MVTVEYLLPFDTVDGVCKDVKSFYSLLGSNANFKIKSDKISFKRSSYNFSVEQTDVINQNCSVFHVTFGVSRTTDKFREMLKAFRKTVGLHLQDRIQIVWDGVSFEWSKELYPRLYQIENSMRKLISKFMLTKLGIGWHKSSIPKDVKESIKDSNYKPSHGILYEVDFIQLANFLFKEYSLKDSSKLPDVLNAIVENGFDEDKKEEILEYIPKNNWDRYFSDLVNLESDQLRKKWELLYDIRIKVAHNKSMNLDNYERANELCSELEKVLSEALEHIDTIEIPDDEKESVSLKTIGTINEPTRHFVNEYIDLNHDISNSLNLISDRYPFLKDIENPISVLAHQPDYLNIGTNPDLYGNLNTIDSFKNNIVSGDSYLNLDNSFDSDLFKTTRDRFNTALDTGSIYLDKLNEGLKLPTGRIKYNEDGTISFDNDDNDI